MQKKSIYLSLYYKFLKIKLLTEFIKLWNIFQTMNKATKYFHVKVVI